MWEKHFKMLLNNQEHTIFTPYPFSSKLWTLKSKNERCSIKIILEIKMTLNIKKIGFTDVYP